MINYIWDATNSIESASGKAPLKLYEQNYKQMMNFVLMPFFFVSLYFINKSPFPFYILELLALLLNVLRGTIGDAVKHRVNIILPLYYRFSRLMS